MADYVLTCPKCEGPMWDQRAVGNRWPWKPGTPIAKCKNKDCAKAGGVYWEDSKAGPKAAAKPVPNTAGQAPVTSGKGPAPFDVQDSAYFTKGAPFDAPQNLKSLADDGADYAQTAYTVALSIGKCIEDCFNDGDVKTAEALSTLLSTSLQAAAATVYIQRKKVGK